MSDAAGTSPAGTPRSTRIAPAIEAITVSSRTVVCTGVGMSDAVRVLGLAAHRTHSAAWQVRADQIDLLRRYVERLGGTLVMDGRFPERSVTLW